MDQYKFPCEPVANRKSIVSGKNYRFTLIDERVIRYEWAHDGVFEDRASTFAINRNFTTPEFQVVDKKEQLDIFTPNYRLTYDKRRFSPNGLFASFTSKQLKWGVEWRYSVDDTFNLGGTARTLDEVNGRIDMGEGIISRSGYANLDDSSSMLFDGKGFVTTRRSGDRIDGYLFVYGFDYKSAMRSFYAISGQQPTVPRWCLGNWWSRYHAYDDKEYLSLMDKFKAKDIPLSVAVIDMDWHLTDGDEVETSGWTGYTWNKDLFPDPKKFQQALHDRSLKITLNDHPRDGIHKHEDMYEKMAKVLGHDTSNGTPILFDPTSPKFMHAYLTVLHRKLEDEGCDFWWIDWQQGSYSRIAGFDPLWLLNHFHYLDNQQQRGKADAMIFSRYAGPGSHRYPVGFSGDTFSTWDSLVFQPEFTATASNIGYGWWSHDIGGHLRGFRDDECTVRWVQSGVWSPLMRLHSTTNKWMSKEPWLYRTECEVAIRDVMQFRHRLVPYIYSSSVSSDLPLIQPLYWNYPQHSPAYGYPTQYFFGEQLVVSPVLKPRDKRSDLAKTRVWIAPQRHVDIFTGTIYDGEQEIDLYRPLSGTPVLAPEGSIIPLDKELVPANGCPNPDALEVLVVVGKDGAFDLIENVRDDAGSTTTSEDRRVIHVKYNQSAGRLTFTGGKKSWKVCFVSANVKQSDVKIAVNGSAMDDASCTKAQNKFVANTVITVPATSKLDDEISIDVGSNPQLSVLDHTEAIRALVLDLQIEFATKDRIWEIIEGGQSTSTKVARLLSLNLEEPVIGPVFELLLADGR